MALANTRAAHEFVVDRFVKWKQDMDAKESETKQASSNFYVFEDWARESGIALDASDLPEGAIERLNGFGLGPEQVSVSYDISKDRYVWSYRRNIPGETRLLTSLERLPPTSRHDYARFWQYARAAIREEQRHG